ncbi:MAG: hypothetical protein M3Q81_03840 [bacterium]|nr:hypothetical protein [bacterium]
MPDRAQFGEGVAIENLSDQDRSTMRAGTPDLKQFTLMGTAPATGTVRYDIADERVRLSVTAALPPLSTGQYQVWFKQDDSEVMQKAFTLTAGKGGFTGDAAVSAALLPFDVVVSRELSPDEEIEEILLQGTITRE